MSDIIVIGTQGQLARCLKDLRPQWKFLGRPEIDLENANTIKKAITKKPEWIINAAAYTQVDKAETEQAIAMKVNSEASGVLASLCENYLGVSTDYVFDGRGNKPYRETDPCGPIGTYGRSKWEGEKKAIENNAQSIILRTSWVYSEYGNNFLKTMSRLAKEKDKISVVNDQKGSPTYAKDLARTIVRIVESNPQIPWGIYHYANSGECTWFEFAKFIVGKINPRCEVVPISTEQYPTAAKRPQYSVLSTEKIKRTLSLEIPDWKSSAEECLKKYLS